MIDYNQIQKLATQYPTSAFNVIREYLQNLFLSYFYQQPQTDAIYFKGGTALRLFYRSPRFSEDLDFSTNQQNVPGIEQILLEVFGIMEKENIQADLQEADTTSGGYLSVIDFTIYGRTIPIEIEISFREKDNTGTLVTISTDFIPPYTLVILEENQLISQKMRALRARKKARDFYDLYFILRKQLPLPDKSSILPEALAALRSTDANFEAELKQFLPKSHWPIIRDFRVSLEREINRFL